jgi:hypothetical protein
MRVRRGLGGKSLDCGCFVGTYETYDGRVVTLIDVRGEKCAERGHRRNAQLAGEQPRPSVALAGSGSSRK